MLSSKWRVNSEIIKQVTSSWPIFIQLQRSVNRCTLVEVLYEIFVNIGCNKKLYVLQRLTIFRTCKQQHSIGCNYTQRVIGCKLNVICDLNYSRERISAKSVFCSEKFNFFFKIVPRNKHALRTNSNSQWFVAFNLRDVNCCWDNQNRAFSEPDRSLLRYMRLSRGGRESLRFLKLTPFNLVDI